MEEKEKRAMKTSYLIKRFLPYFKKYRWILVLDLFCAALTTVCELVLPLIVRYLTIWHESEALTIRLILSIELFISHCGLWIWQPTILCLRGT